MSKTNQYLDDEKDVSLSHVEDINQPELRDVENAYSKRPDSVDIDAGFDAVALKKTLRKVDFRLLPVLMAMYTVSQMDRGNLSLARAANKSAMSKDLGLTIGQRYSLITLAFFPPYIALEIPSQLGLRRFGARIWLGGATIAWGLAMLGMGFSKTWQELAGLRALLGAFEAVLFPGATYLISCWYPRSAIALRMAIFYQVSYAIAGCSALVSYGISQMHLTAGMHGWQWIFVIYGIITVIIGFIAFAFISDFPDKAKWLHSDERDIILTRIERDRKDSEYDHMTAAKAWKYTCDLKLWLFAYFFLCSAMGAYSLAYFLPQILATMGFNNAMSQVLVAPPNVWGLVPALVTAWISDKYKLRMWMLVLNACQTIVGTLMYTQLPKAQLAARYAGVFIASGGINANIGVTIGWAQSAIRSQSKRGYSSALIVGFGGVGGIVASLAFMEKESKIGYPTGVWLTVGMNVSVIVIGVLLRLWMIYKNRKADRGECIIEGDADFRYQ